MEIIDKTIKSKYQPKQTNVTWIDLSGEKPVEKHFINGRWVAISGGEGGTKKYSDLEEKPTINGVELDGNKTSQDLGVYSKPSTGIPQSDLSSDVQSQLNKHFKGWYAAASALPANPIVGDYAYVKGAESTDPAAIYECTTAGTWSNSGRTADTSNVQTFASGEEVNEVHIVNDLSSDNTTDLLGNSILKQQLVYYTPDYLKGVTFGNTTAALTIKSIVKAVWLEDNNGYITYPDKLYFVLFRNRASSGYFFQFGVDESTIWFTINGNTKLIGVNQLSISIYRSYGSDVKLHLSLDFTEHSEDINYGKQDTCYLSPSLLNKEEPLVITTKDKVVRLNDNIDTIAEQVQENTQSLLYENPLSGFNIPDSLKQILKSAWIQILDNSVVIPNGKKVGIRNTNDSDINFIFSIQDEEDNYIFLTSSSNPISEGVHELTLNGYSNYRDKVILHIVFDMPETVPYTIYYSDIVFLNVMTYPSSNATVKSEVLDLSKPLKGKTIVCFGDSITEFKDNSGLGYCNYIHNISGANVINVACGGAQIRQRTTPVLNPTNNREGYAGMDIVNVVRAAANVPFDGIHTYRDVVQNACDYIYSNLGDDNRIIISNLLAIDWTKVNAVTILGGVNDWNNGGNTRGASGGTDENTTLGAVNVIIQTLLSAYPHLSVYWLTPTVHWAANVADRNDSNWSDVEVKDGYTLKQLSEAIKQEVELQHLPVCDLYNTLGWNKFNFGQYFTDTDGTHPYKGFEFLGRKIAAFIMAISC